MPFWAPGFWSGDTGSGGTSSNQAAATSAVSAQDIIIGALRFINSYAPGESLSSSDAGDALTTLNDLLDSLSTDEASVFGTMEAILSFTPNKYIYTIGNYDAGQFAGTITLGSPVITLATIPDDLIINGDLSAPGIAEGTYVTAVDRVAFTVTMSGNATSSSGIQQIGYTVPGDFKVERPLRVTTSFTRITTQNSGLDYPIQIVSQERYIEIGYKGISAPWPICAWYNPTMPLGTLYFYQNPSGPGELHLFTDTILTRLQDVTSYVYLPQGYVRMLKRLLARDLAPEYGAIWTPNHERLTTEAVKMVKSLNQVPTPVAKYDTEISNMGQRSDAGWILNGGFR